MELLFSKGGKSSVGAIITVIVTERRERIQAWSSCDRDLVRFAVPRLAIALTSPHTISMTCWMGQTNPVQLHRTILCITNRRHFLTAHSSPLIFLSVALCALRSALCGFHSTLNTVFTAPSSHSRPYAKSSNDPTEICVSLRKFAVKCLLKILIRRLFLFVVVSRQTKK